jgi:hypothetical protein
MSKKVLCLVMVFCFLALASTVATAQEELMVYTYASHWGIPRAQWPEAAAAFKESQAAMERLLANGTIVAWGNGAPIVHRDEGNTHGSWFSATSLTGIEKALEELANQPASPVLNDAKHHDHLSRSIVHKGRTSATTTGYSWGSGNPVKPGKADAWLEFFNKTSKPVFDKLVADGTILQYEVFTDLVHTSDPNGRRVNYIAPNLAALEKAREALAAMRQSLAPSYFPAFADLVTFEEHRDGFWALEGYGHR